MSFADSQPDSETPYENFVEPAPAVRTGVGLSLLDQLVAETKAVSGRTTDSGRDIERDDSPVQSDRSVDAQLRAFLSAETPREALTIWFGEETLLRHAGEDWSRFARKIQQAVAKIDALVTQQLLEILHHPKFQKLESSWRGIEHLINVKNSTEDAPTKIRILNASYSELFKDFDNAVEFDQSILFRKVYEEQFGTAGGEPFGVLLADYDIHPRPSKDHPYDDIAMLRSFSQIAAAAFCPTILNASPSMFSHDAFADMQVTADYSKVHDDKTFLTWRSFRESEDSRFISLTLPRMLLRRHYRDRLDREDGLPFSESLLDAADCLWGGAVFGFGEVLLRAFANNRWLADIRGAQRGKQGGGLVEGIGPESFDTDRMHVAEKPLVELQVSDTLERQLVDLGFMPLCSCKDMPSAAFYSCPSTQRPKRYDSESASANARISAMINYMLCVSRFAHYIKVIGRDKIGSFLDASELQYSLEQWINKYVTPDSEASQDTKARYPLREAQIRITPSPGKPGAFDCFFDLAPHYELEDMQASIRLRTEILRSN